MDIPTSEAAMKWHKSNSAVMIVAVVALVGFLILLVLIGVFNVAVPFWAWLFLLPLLLVARVLMSISRWRALRLAETAFESQSTRLTDNTLAAAQRGYRATKRQP